MQLNGLQLHNSLHEKIQKRFFRSGSASEEQMRARCVFVSVSSSSDGRSSVVGRRRRRRKASYATLSNHLRWPRVPAALVNWEQRGCVPLSRCEDADEETLCTCADDKSDDAKPRTSSRRPQESSSSVNMPCAVVRPICR